MSTHTTTTLANRIAQVQQQAASAAQRAGRDPGTITVVGVCKTVERPAVDEAVRATGCAISARIGCRWRRPSSAPVAPPI